MALKRANGEGNLRKRSNGTWEARVTLGTDSKTGKLISKSVYARTQKEGREKMKALLGIDGGQAATPPAAPKEPPKPKPEDVITVGQWLDTWLKEYKINLRPETKSSYEMHIRVHLKPDLGKIRLNKLTTHQIQHLYNKLINERGLSPKTVKNVHGALHAALEQAKINGYLRVNPSEGTTLPKIEKEELQVMDSQDVSAFLRAIKGGRVRAALVCRLIHWPSAGRAARLDLGLRGLRKGNSADQQTA